MLDKNFVLQLAGRDTDINEYLMSLYNIPVQMKAQTIVELGAGQSTFALCAAVNKTAGQFYSIDLYKSARDRLWEGNHGMMLDDEPRYHFIQGNDMEIVKSWDKPIDFLFIDTSHQYEHTKQELEAWTPYVVGGGIIMMHDTGHESEDMKGCRRALDEFVEKNRDSFVDVHLLDRKLIGMSVLIKFWSR